jgi:predicted permease
MTPADSNGSLIQTTLWVLSGAVGLLLLIACANLANLMLSRNGSRTREMALRHSLGASRRRLVAHLLGESLAIAVIGGAAGLLLAHWLTVAIASLRPANLVVLERIQIDGPVVAFAALSSLLTAVLFGLAPAISASRVDLQHLIHVGDRSSTPAGHRARLVLTAAQIAIALVLLVGASLLVRSFARLTAIDPGFNPDGLVTIRVSLPNARYGDPNPEVARARRQQFFDAWLETARTTPGVTSAAVGNGVPPELGIMIGRLEIDGSEAPPGPATSSVYSGGYVTPDYFSTLGIPLLEGRAFAAEDSVGNEAVAIISAGLAGRHWPDGRAIGARVRLQGREWSRVVGIVGDVRANAITGGDQVQVYFSRAQVRPGFGVLIVRTAIEPAAIIPALKARTWELDPKLPLPDIATASAGMARARSQHRFTLTLIAAFAASGLALAALGVYGVMSLYVGQRRREVGIRVALGATRRDVMGLILRQTTAAMAAGLAVGGTGAILARQSMATLLYETTPGDPVSFAVAVFVVVAAALGATLLPVRQAASVDPATVLKVE